MKNSMQAPKILPWVARKAGLSEELALKLWRLAVSEAEYLTGQSSGSEYWGLAVERFLTHVEDESRALTLPGSCPLSAAGDLPPAPRLTWVWRHQSRLSMLSVIAAQNTYQFWHNTWNDLVGPRKAA